MNKNILLIGSPGSGKGSFTAHLKSLGYKIVAMGDILRREVGKETTLGLKVKKNVNNGILIPDSLALEIMTKELQPFIDNEIPFVIEGFPSTISQYEAFIAFLHDQQMVDKLKVIFLNCPEELALERIITRLICKECSQIYNQRTRPPQKNDICDRCGGVVYHRPEDTLEIGRRRIENFKIETLPIVDLVRESFSSISVKSESDLEHSLKGVLSG